MKKRILCIALAVVLVAAAVFFAVYQAYGHTFDYANKDMSKYLSLTLDDLKNADDKSIKYDDFQAEEKDALAYIAKQLTDYSKLGLGLEYTGKIGKFDTVVYVYYMTMKGEDGNPITISLGSKLDPTLAASKLSKVQMNDGSDLSDILSALVGEEVDAYSFNAITKISGTDVQNPIFDKDTVYFDWDKVTAEGAKESDTYAHYKLDEMDAEFGEGFAAEIKKLQIGDSKKEFTLADGTKYTVTIRFVTRDTVNGGEVKTGDKVYFKYKEVGGAATLTYYGIMGTDDSALDTKFGTGFAAALFATPIDYKDAEDSDITTKEIKANLNGTEKTYEVDIDYVYRADADENDPNLVKAEFFKEITHKYADDAKDVAEIKDKDGKPIELKGKEVTFHVAPLYRYEAVYDLEAIVNTFKYPSTEDMEGTAFAKYLTAYAKYLQEVKDVESAEKNLADAADDKKEDAQKKLDTAKSDLEKAITALGEFNKDTKYDDKNVKTKLDAYLEAYAKHFVAKLAYEKAADDKKAEAETAMNEAKTALDTALGEYVSDRNANKEEGEEDVKAEDITPEALAIESYDEYAWKMAQKELDTDFRYDIAELIWNNLLKQVEGKVTFPKKALRVTYEALYDSKEEDYFENKTSKYSKYKNLKAYLNGELGADWKAKLEAEAEQIVFQNIVLYRMVELTGVELSDSDLSMISFFALYMGYSEEGQKSGKLFDKVMGYLTEELYPDIFPKEDENTENK